jgi:hypothetical protein
MGDLSLEALQRLLVDAIRSDEKVASRPDLATSANRLVASGAALDAAARLEIYREQFWLRHLSNLSEDFPTLAWVVGAAAFREIAIAYLKSHPPRSWDLQRLGAALPTFVAQLGPWSDDSLVRDAAVLDWAFMEAFDAPDAGPLDLQALAGAPQDAWPSTRFTLHPSVRRVILGHPAHELRDAVRRGEARDRPAAGTTPVVVWRDPRCFLHATAVEPMAFELLGELARGASLGAACESVASAHAHGGADLGEQVGTWFQRWTAEGWVSAVHL